jgi:hypothetical protein
MVAIIQNTFQVKTVERFHGFLSKQKVRGYSFMMESEVKIYDSSISLRSMDVENINPVITMPFETVEITSHFEEVRREQVMRFVRKRKVRRVKSGGIF